MAINFSIPGLTIAPEEQFSQLVLVVSNLSVGISNMQTQLNAVQNQIAELQARLDSPAPTPTPTPVPNDIVYHNADPSPTGIVYTGGLIDEAAGVAGPGMSMAGLRTIRFTVPEFDVSSSISGITLYVDQFAGVEGLLTQRQQGVSLSTDGRLFISIGGQDVATPVNFVTGDEFLVVMSPTRIGAYHKGRYYGHTTQLSAPIETPHLHVVAPGATFFDVVIEPPTTDEVALADTPPPPAPNTQKVMYNCVLQDDILQYIGGSLPYDDDQSRNACAVMATMQDSNQVISMVVPLLTSEQSIEIGLQTGSDCAGASALQGRMVLQQNGDRVELTNSATELFISLVPHTRIEIWFESNAQNMVVRSTDGSFADQPVMLSEPVEDAFAAFFWYGCSPASALQLAMAPRGET